MTSRIQYNVKTQNDNEDTCYFSYLFHESDVASTKFPNEFHHFDRHDHMPIFILIVAIRITISYHYSCRCHHVVGFSKLEGRLRQQRIESIFCVPACLRYAPVVAEIATTKKRMILTKNSKNLQKKNKKKY